MGRVQNDSTLTVADQMQFISVAKEVLEKIANIQGKKEKESHLKKCFQFYRKAFKGTHNETLNSELANGDSIFPLVRLLLPNDDKSRAPYGMKGTVLARTFVKALGLDENGSDAKKLLHFRDPHRSTVAGDLGSVIHSVLKSRFASVSTSSSPTLAELNHVLDKLAKGGGVNSEKQVEILKRFIPKLSALEGKWLARLILKQMGLGLSKHQVFRCIHPRAEALFETTGSLKIVCERLNDPDTTIDETQVQLFCPFKQMLCARLNVKYDDVSDQGKRRDFGNLPEPPFLVEIKFDGERFQIHYDSSRPADQRFRYFSRSGIDNTTNFAATHTGRLIPQVKSSCSSFILDGEMMAYRKSTGGFTHKGQNIDVRRMKVDDPEHQPAFVAFDIVYFNGQSLTNLKLEERLKLISQAVEEEEGVISVSKTKIVDSKESIMDELNQAVDDFQEGLIVKQLDSVYEIGKRANTWLKIKPEYFSENSVEDLDVIILGAYYTDSVRHRGNINHFLVGLLGTSDSEIEFYPLGRVGTGRLRHPDIAKLVEELKPKFIKKPDTNCTVHLQNFKRPDLYINPKKSVVVQIRAMEILPHEDHAIKYSLRFARIIQVRRDKCWNEVLTVPEFYEIQKSYGGKFARRSDGLPSTPKKKPFKMSHQRRSRSDSESPERPPRPVASSSPSISLNVKYFTINNSYKTRGILQKQKPSPVKQNILQSHVFRVIGSLQWKARIEEKIIEYGGQIVKNNTSDLFAIIAENVSASVEKLMKRQEHDILKLSWLERCIENRCIEQILPEDCFSASKRTREILRKEYDDYGDSYLKKLSSVETRRLLDSVMLETCAMDDSGVGTDDVCDVLASEDIIAAKIRKYSFLKDCKIAFETEDLDSLDLFGLKMSIQFYGGYVVDKTDKSATHLVVSDDSDDILPSANSDAKPTPVHWTWLQTCLEQRKILPVETNNS